MNKGTRVQRVLQWLLTSKGKKIVYAATVTAGIGVIGAYSLPHVFFLQKYKALVHYYKNGWPLPVPKLLAERYNKTLDLLQIPDEDRVHFEPFMVCGLNTFNAGTSYSIFGAIIGLPFNFTYENVEDIKKSEIVLFGNPIDWSVPESNDLLDSFVLSENAQMFAIAREVLESNSLTRFLSTTYATSVIVFMYGLGSSLNTKYNLYERPRSLRIGLYSLITLFGYGVYALLKDGTQNYWDKQTDEELGKLSPVFVEGGKEFYEKMIARNVALRKLLGWRGEWEYTALGNDNYWLRVRHVPLVDRRDYFTRQALYTVV